LSALNELLGAPCYSAPVLQLADQFLALRNALITDEGISTLNHVPDLILALAAKGAKRRLCSDIQIPIDHLLLELFTDPMDLLNLLGHL
jgi:hypothetical protein